MEPKLCAFNSVEEECRFWKERTKIYRDDWLTIKQEYDEFVELSRQMENEMDATLKQKQHKIDELNSHIVRLEDANDALKQKVASQSVELTNCRILIDITQKDQESIKKNLRNLEQKNDDLERIQRTLRESMNDMSDSLDKAYEKNAILENEIDEKVALEEKLQRLTDEMRDLKQEFNTKLMYKAKGKFVDGKVGTGKLIIKVGRKKRQRQNILKLNARNSSSKSAEKPEHVKTDILNRMPKNSLSILTDMLTTLNTIQQELDVYRDAASE